MSVDAEENHTETGLYVTATRYYNPEWGRWLNADAMLGKIGALLGHNLFTYCINSPVNRKDTNGADSESAILIRTQNAAMIDAHSENPPEGAITVAEYFANLDALVESEWNAITDGDPTGCASWTAKGLPHGMSQTGATTIFWGKPSSEHPDTKNKKQTTAPDLILWGEIDDIGGVEGLIPGMQLGERSTKRNRSWQVKHTGIYAGLRDLGNGRLEPAVYSFNYKLKRGRLRKYNVSEWDLYGWHRALKR